MALLLLVDAQRDDCGDCFSITDAAVAATQTLFVEAGEKASGV
mgnify:CR=1 FL=1